jgi:protein-serine/threonine kinase
VQVWQDLFPGRKKSLASKQYAFHMLLCLIDMGRLYATDEDEDEEASWEFDTVRARPSVDLSQGADFLSVHLADDTPNPTIRAPTSKVPVTLRMLFEDSDQPVEPLQISGLDTPISIPSSSLLPPPSVPALRGRNRSRSGATSPSEPEEDILTAKQPTFQFPPRSAVPRMTRKLSTADAHHDDDDDISTRDKHPPLGPGIPTDRHPPLGPGIPRDQHPPLGAGIPREPHPPLGVGIPRHPPLGPGIPSRQSPSQKSSRSSSPQSSPRLGGDIGHQEIEIPSFSGSSSQKDRPPPIVFSASSPTAPSPRPSLNRQRSKSSAIDPPGSLKSMQDWNFSSQSPSTFQFPPAGFAQPSTPPPLSAPPSRTHNRVSPTHASASTISTVSRMSHQFTHSLDAAAISRRYQTPASLPAPSPVMRSRSAAPYGDPPTPVMPTSNGPEAVVSQAIPRKPSMTRLASLPVMETVHTPSRPFARTERSGSLDTGPPVPGLKDVLKVTVLLYDFRGQSADIGH